MCQRLTLRQALSGCEGKRAQRQQSPTNRPSLPALSILPHLYLAKRRGTVIRTDILSWSREEDKTARNVLIWIWGLEATSPSHGPRTSHGRWGKPHSASHPSGTFYTRVEESLEDSKQVFECTRRQLLFSLVCISWNWKTEKLIFTVSYCPTPAWKVRVSEVLQALRRNQVQLLFLVTLSSSHFFAKSASMQMLVKVSTEVDYSRVLNLLSRC